MKKSVAAKLLGYLLLALTYPIFGVIGAMIAARVVNLFQDVQRFPNIVHFLRLEAQAEAPLQASLRHFMPTRLGGRDIGAFLVGLALYLLTIGLKHAAARLKTLSGQWKAEAEAAAVLDRGKLLEIYANAKTKLEALKRPAAFLSMDVVDSTGLKKGEDPSVAERDFRQYKQMVEKCLAASGVLKSTWTPDGVMACFDDAASAVRAGRDTIAGLAEFNAKVKNMRGDFKLRAGVNGGLVLYDAATPMEEMSDRVIDVAGHMQKYGSVNCICAPTELVEPLAKDFGFKPAGRVVDGFPVSEWSPVAAPSQTA